MPIAELTIAITPKIASAKRPSESMRMKKPPMTALKSVRTLAVTMLATERLLGGSGGPRRANRRSASALESPPICPSAVAPLTRSFIDDQVRLRPEIEDLPGAHEVVVLAVKELEAAE